MKTRLFAILIAGCFSTGLNAEDSVGESMGRTARDITDGMENAYLNTEAFFADTADSFDRHSRNAGRSIEEFFEQVSAPVEEFTRDVEKGYLAQPGK